MEERRREHRQRVLKAAKVVFNERQCLYDCRIHDLTVAGARLRIEHAWLVPQHFGFVDVAHEAASLRPARVVWRGNGEVGITFEAVP